MIKVIMGLKGSGKTKKLIESINEAVKQAPSRLHSSIVAP